MSLFIPEKIKVGFQERSDTYTKRLGYITYYDEKGKLRKETSWQRWRNDKIDPVECDNEPTEGFVLNRNGGGGRGWDSRAEFVRVWDPRGFEFEIGIGNLLLILAECDCTKGKGLEGKFVYAWSGTTLVLLPTSSKEYKEGQKYTALQDKKIYKKDLVPGRVYITKKDQLKYVYLGEFLNFYMKPNVRKKQMVFYKKCSYRDVWEPHFFKDLTRFACEESEEIVDNYAELVDDYNQSKYGSKAAKLLLKPLKDYNYSQDGDKFTEKFTQSHKTTWIENGKLHANEYIDRYALYNRHYYYSYNYAYAQKVPNPSNMGLYVELESGSQFKVHTFFYNGKADISYG